MGKTHHSRSHSSDKPLLTRQPNVTTCSIINYINSHVLIHMLFICINSLVRIALHDLIPIQSTTSDHIRLWGRVLYLNNNVLHSFSEELLILEESCCLVCFCFFSHFLCLYIVHLLR